MNAKELIQSLKTQIELQKQFDLSEAVVSQPIGNKELAKTRIMFPIEGTWKVFEVEAKEIATYEGIEIQAS